MRPFARAALAAFLAFLASSAVHPALANDNLRAAAQPLATGTPNNTLVYDLARNEAVMGVNVAGLTASGATLTLEGSSDAKALSDATKTWFSVVGVPFSCPSPAVFTTLTADQSFKVDTSGLTNIRFRVSSAGSGSATIGLNAIPGAAMAVCGGGAGVGGAVNSAGATSIVQPDKSANASPSTATTTQIVALSGSKVIYVTSYDFDVLASATAAGGFYLEYGTGTACATGTTALTPTKSYPAGGGISRGGSLGAILTVPAGNALCIVTTAAQPVAIDVSYAQF